MKHATMWRATAAAFALAAALGAAGACETIFPPRSGVDYDTGGGGGGGNNGGYTGQGSQVYGYDPGCNCSQGYSCSQTDGICKQYTCFASGGTWREARDNCARQGMHLVLAADDGENDFVTELCRETPAEEWWVGGNDVLREGDFRDETDAPFAYGAWHDGEPAQDDRLDCAAQDESGGWSAGACQQKRAYVCATPLSSVPIRPVGGACSTFGTAQGCNAAQLCYEAAAELYVGVCSYPCGGADECVEGTRCTTTPAGRLCLRRCEETWECTGENSSLRCIHTPSGDGVCWTQGARSGEVQTSPDIVLDHIDFDTGSGGGWPRPGEQAVLHIYVRNDGDGDAFDVSGTVAPVGAQLYVAALSNETGSAPIIPAGGGVVEIVTPTLTLKPELPLGTPAQFQLTVNAGTSLLGRISFGVTAYPSAALPWVTEVQVQGGVLVPGSSDRVTLLAENLGFAAVSDVRAEVAVVSGQAAWTPGELVVAAFQDPALYPSFAPQRVAVGNLNVLPAHPAGEPVVLGVTLRESGGTVWEQDVSVPVQ
jgi:hypothetical protein